MWIGNSLQKKIVFATALYTIVLLGCVLVYISISGEKRIRSEAEQEVGRQLEFLQNQFEQELESAAVELKGVRSRLDFAFLQNRNQDGRTEVMLQIIREFLTGFHQKYAEVRLYLPPPHGGFRITPIQEFEFFDVRVSPLPAELFLDVATVSPDSFRFRPPAMGQYGRVVGFDGALKNVPGYGITGLLNLDYLLESVLSQPGWGQDDQIYVADTSWCILYAQDPLLRDRRLDQIDAPFFQSRDTENSLRIHCSDGFCTGSLYWAKAPAWLVIRKDIREPLAAWRQKILNISLFTGLLALAALAFVWAAGTRLSQSLRNVAQVASQVAEGDFSQKLNATQQDELGVLYRAFNEMTDKLQTSYDTLRQTNRELADKVQELSDTRKILSQKERLALVGEAVSKVSHEIQNKIGGVSIWVQNLEIYLGDDERAQVFIQELKQALNSFMHMMVHFKRFYREPVLDREQVSFPDLIKNAVLQVQKEADSKRLRIDVEEASALPHLSADSAQLTDVFVNLLLNAIYFSPEDGRIQIHVVENSDGVSVSISDDGPGLQMDPDQLFQPFVTSKSSGSGLGLAIAQNIVRAHRGQITCTNREAGGACFTVNLPLERDV